MNVDVYQMRESGIYIFVPHGKQPCRRRRGAFRYTRFFQNHRPVGGRASYCAGS